MNTDHEAQAAFGKALEEARVEAGAPSYKNIERALIVVLGAYTPVDETIRNYHNGKVSPEKADLVLVKALAEFYGKEETDFGPVIAERLTAMRTLLGAKTPTKKGSRRRGSGCNPDLLNLGIEGADVHRYAHVA